MRISVLFVLALSLAACGREPVKDDTANAVTTAAEADEDPGVVSNATMEQMLARTMNRFAKLDLNGDGKLTQEELDAATAGGDHSDGNVQHPRQGYSARAFEGADADGDGVVTRDEAEASARARFKRLDVNGDGKVSKDEFAAERAAAGQAGR